MNKELEEYKEAVAGFCKEVLRIAGTQATAMGKYHQANMGLKETNDAVIAIAKGKRINTTRYGNI